MRGCKQDCGQCYSGALAWEEAGEARHEEVVQKELLIERPENVAGHVLEVGFV